MKITPQLEGQEDHEETYDNAWRLYNPYWDEGEKSLTVGLSETT